METECYYRAQAGFELTTSASASQGLGQQAWATLPTLRTFSSAIYKDMLGFIKWESPGWRKRVPLNSDLSVPLEAGVWVSLHARLSANKEERRFRGAGAPARLGSCRLCTSADWCALSTLSNSSIATSGSPIYVFLWIFTEGRHYFYCTYLFIY